MEPAASIPLSSEQLIALGDALGEIRDSLVTISLALTDFVTETPSKGRDDVLIEVKRYLCRISEADEGNFE